jgi:hypothetical protein
MHSFIGSKRSIQEVPGFGFIVSKTSESFRLGGSRIFAEKKHIGSNESATSKPSAACRVV